MRRRFTVPKIAESAVQCEGVADEEAANAELITLELFLGRSEGHHQLLPSPKIRLDFLVEVGHCQEFFFCELHHVRPKWKESSEEVVGAVPPHRTHGRYRLKGRISDLEEGQKRCTASEPLLDPEYRPRRPRDPAHEQGEEVIQDRACAREPQFPENGAELSLFAPEGANVHAAAIDAQVQSLIPDAELHLQVLDH
jgi:hypothetical protein